MSKKEKEPCTSPAQFDALCSTHVTLAAEVADPSSASFIEPKETLHPLHLSVRDVGDAPSTSVLRHSAVPAEMVAVPLPVPTNAALHTCVLLPSVAITLPDPGTWRREESYGEYICTWSVVTSASKSVHDKVDYCKQNKWTRLTRIARLTMYDISRGNYRHDHSPADSARHLSCTPL